MMNLFIRTNGGQRALMPFFVPINTFEVRDRLSRETWDSWRPFTEADGVVPQTDIYEERGQLVMKTELPGIGKDDLDVTLEGDTLTIKAERKEEVREDATHHARERRYGKYVRSMILPYAVKENEISATLDNGVLELRLPKAEEPKTRNLEIKTRRPQAETKPRQRRTTKKNN